MTLVISMLENVFPLHAKKTKLPSQVSQRATLNVMI